MKRILLVLGCYGLVVSSASAGEKWPTNVCKEIATLRGIFEASKRPAPEIAHQRFGLLLLQESHCGVNTRALQEADIAAVAQGEKRASPAEQPRRPTLCDSTPKAYGGSHIDCY